MTGVIQAHVYPALFYDFNMPPSGPKGTYRVYLREWSLWPLKPGDQIIFGCANDEVEAYGRIVAVDGDCLTVRKEEWLPSTLRGPKEKE